MSYKTVGIIGAGAWGTALAINIANSGKNVVLWSFDGEYAHFDNLDIPSSVVVVREQKDLADTDIWLVATPAAFFCDTVRRFVPFYKNQPVIICTKGTDSKTHEFMSEILHKELSACMDFGILSGPQFANDVASNLPTGSTLAGTKRVRSAGRAVFNFAQLDETDDVVGVEISGVGKNVVALISGFISVKISSESERAMIFTLCCNEVINIGLAIGAKIETFVGFCGLGDLFLSATSKTSRNFSNGIAIAKSKQFFGTAEGVSGLKTLLVRAKKFGVKTPVLSDMRKKMKI